MISPFEARLSHVYRWPISRMIQRQSVAEHSFRVALSADRIARKWWPGCGNYELYTIGRIALLHDQTEAFGGDGPSSVKPPDWEADLHRRFKTKIVEDPHGNAVMHQIVKIADCYEAIVFLKTEFAMGNSSVDNLLEYVRDKLKKAIGDREDYQKMYRELDMDSERAAAFNQDPLND